MARPASSGARTTYRVDQAVHGYDLGHRLLATSSAAIESAEQLMGAMSDLLTTQLLEANGSYLVGYPLKSKNAFVIARTWAAREMPRPGSVWTHSLILDYQTLAVLQDPISLLGRLRRPTPSTLSSYAKPILIDPDQRAEIDSISPSLATAALAALYADHQDRNAVLATSLRQDDEQLLLALWRQMWPALRRDTAFFSFADDTPPPVDAGCIIRFSSETRTTAIPPEARDALDALMVDLPHSGQTKLRGFLARHAFDAREPRGAVLPLVRLWRAMDERDQGAALQALANVLPLANPNRLLRTVLERFFEAGNPDGSLLDLVERFGDLSVSAGPDSLSPSTTWIAHRDLGELLECSGRYGDGTLGAAIFGVVAATAPIEELADASYDEGTAELLLDARPALLDSAPFWQKRIRAQPKLIERAAAADLPFESVIALARRNISLEGVAALIECWPDRIIDLARDLAAMPDAARLVGAALARAPALLERAVDTKAPISMDLLDEAVAYGFKANVISCPPSSVWSCLPAPIDPYQAPNLAVLTLVAAMAGRHHITPSDLGALMTGVSKLSIDDKLIFETRRYLEKALRAAGIYRWSIIDALNEALVVTFTTGHHVSIDILKAASPKDFNGLLGAINSRLGLGELRDLRSRAVQNVEGSEPWHIRGLDDFIRSREPKLFW